MTKQAFIYFLFIPLSLWNCKSTTSDIDNKELYDGPIKEFENIKAYYSDSAKVKMQMTAAKHELYESGDEVFPEGVFLELFNEDKEISTTISANEAFKYYNKKQYKLAGDVIIKSITSGDELNTEVLYLEADGKIHTDQFVTIKSDGEVHTGEGLTSNSDFSKYQILKPAGTISIDEEF